MKVAVLTEPIPPHAAPDQLDTLKGAEFVGRVLQESSHTVGKFEFRLGDPESLDRLLSWKPEVVFNLVESVNKRTDLIHLPVAVLEAFQIPCTGVPSSGILMTSNKVLAKSMMKAADIPTPQWHDADIFENRGKVLRASYIVKPTCEDASIGIEECSVASDSAKAREQITHLRETGVRDIFVEEYVDGRELNLSIIEERSTPRCLPLAEIEFRGWDAGRPRVVGYRAKWDPESRESRKTVRNFIRRASENELCREIERIGTACWKLFGLRGFCRVDFRVDPEGRPWVLEVNANPCISPDAGFMAAARQAGLSSKDVIERLLRTALS